MGAVQLRDLLSLYSIPEKSEDPSISFLTLRKVVTAAGAKFPWVRASGFLTDIALPEADGDLHFFIETEQGAHDHDAPMMTCEIQGLFKSRSKKSSDPRLKEFKQLFAEKVEVTALLRVWPEHLRDSRQPHFFELHPLLTIGRPGEKPIDFSNRVVWPTGEDPDEMAREMTSILAPPKGLALHRDGSRLTFATPSHSMKRENYVHIEGYYRGGASKKGPFVHFVLYDGPTSGRSIGCLAVEGSAAYGQSEKLSAGRYEIGGLCGLNIQALTASVPTWTPQLCPVLSLKRLSAK